MIGALTTQHDLLASALVRERCPLLHETALLIADPQVRYRGTVGGNVANGDPGNDMPAVMQCLDATYVVQRPHRRAAHQGARLLRGGLLHDARGRRDPDRHPHRRLRRRPWLGL